MKTFEIKGQKRSDVGKKSAKELRAQALVPCVMYGGKENVHFSVVEKDFKHLIYSP
ncbi:MAG: 50S ribosomal protein L25, partial [Salinivirgaceae bacterium]|nr:50S ribosomal protein L25 [Salinivirgaceae bacterium]